MWGEIEVPFSWDVVNNICVTGMCLGVTGASSPHLEVAVARHDAHSGDCLHEYLLRAGRFTVIWLSCGCANRLHDDEEKGEEEKAGKEEEVIF